MKFKKKLRGVFHMAINKPFLIFAISLLIVHVIIFVVLLFRLKKEWFTKRIRGKKDDKIYDIL